MKLPNITLNALLSGAFLPAAIHATAREYDCSPDAVVVLLALVELHAKGEATPSLDIVIIQTTYPHELFLESITQLHTMGLLIRDGDQVAATDKATVLLKAVHAKVEKELERRPNTIAVTTESIASPLIHNEDVTYSAPLQRFPLAIFSPSPPVRKGRKLTKDVVNG